MADRGLSLRDVVKEFASSEGPVRAVDRVSLEIPEGEFVTFLGPSGCGKTTTLRMIAGFETPTSGSIQLHGSDMIRLPANKRPMAMVFQNYALFPHLSVFNNVAYGLRLKKLKHDVIDDAVEVALASMNLSGLGHRDPHQLSGGQQQRVALARAMVMKPDVLLFDEPLSNLDAKLRGQMRTEIRQLQRRMGITSIYVTHDQDEAMSLSDRIVVMNKGVVEQSGTPADIYLRPASLFVADFIGTANFVRAQIMSVGEGSARVRALGHDTTVAAHPKARADTSGVLVVRPESVFLEPSSPQDANGTVTAVVYLGPVAEYHVESAEGGLVGTVSNPDPTQLLREGDAVRVGFDRTRGYLLPED
jgi:iron(III) transport system ATP-binding protein